MVSGWPGSNGLWEEVGLGAEGESITYEPNMWLGAFCCLESVGSWVGFTDLLLASVQFFSSSLDALHCSPNLGNRGAAWFWTLVHFWFAWWTLPSVTASGRWIPVGPLLRCAVRARLIGWSGSLKLMVHQFIKWQVWCFIDTPILKHTHVTCQCGNLEKTCTRVSVG